MEVVRVDMQVACGCRELGHLMQPAGTRVGDGPIMPFLGGVRVTWRSCRLVDAHLSPGGAGRPAAGRTRAPDGRAVAWLTPTRPAARRLPGEGCPQLAVAVRCADPHRGVHEGTRVRSSFGTVQAY